MDRYSDRLPSSQFVFIFASELEFMAGQASKFRASETGGGLYGHPTHSGRLVIMYATPPGPNAVHRVAYSQLDPGFFQKASSLLWNELGIQPVGTWHSHHGLSIKSLSGRDIRSSHSFASRNGIHRHCQLLLTFEKGPDTKTSPHRKHEYLIEDFSEPRGYWSSGKSRTAGKCARPDKDVDSLVAAPQFIAVRCFFYPDGGNSQPVPCPIRVIPRKSPIRLALEQGQSFLARTQDSVFPLKRIIYESVGHEGCGDKRPGVFPSRLHKQFSRLPLRVQDETTLKYTEGFIILSLPTLHASGRIIAAFSQDWPYPIVAVYYSKGPSYDKPTNLTEITACRGEFTKLKTVYKRAIRVLGLECLAQQEC